MTSPISDNLEARIINELMLAQQSIKIAVAWFNSQNILNVLCWKLKGGIKVELIMHYDEINTGSDYSLDFTEYKRLGGTLIWAKSELSTMHVKFCIIDEKVVLHGSCNWTNRAFKKNDEVLNVTTDEPQMVNSYLSKFLSLQEKYTHPVATLKNKGYSTLPIMKVASKDERIRLFIEEMERYDIKQYGGDYIKSFLDYWTGYSNDYKKAFIKQHSGKANSLKMRFEDKADFVMMLELENWGKKRMQMKEDEEYELFCRSKREETEEAYQQYCIYIEECSPWPDFTKRLNEMYEEIQENAEVYKSTTLKDIFPQCSERYKSNIYDYIIKHGLPIIITKSDISDLIQYPVQYGVYSYQHKLPYIENGLYHSKYERWWWRFSGLSTIEKLEQYFHCTLIEYCQVPTRKQLPTFEDYSKRYVESCVFNSRFGYRLKGSGEEKTLDKVRLKLLLETAYAIERYNKRMDKYVKKYGNMLIGNILNDNEASLVGEIHVEKYLSYSFLKLRIMHDPNKRGIKVEYDTQFYCSDSLYPQVIIPRINEVLGIDIEYSEEMQNLNQIWSESVWYTLSNDIYYAREKFRFLSLKEVCEFEEGKIEFKPIMQYYKEIKSWT